MAITDRFTRLQKVAIFLIALGEERTREILADVDLDTVEQLNTAMLGLGNVKPEERAAVMLEFARFFYNNEPVHGAEDPITPTASVSKKNPHRTIRPPAPAQKTSTKPADADALGGNSQSETTLTPLTEDNRQSETEEAILKTLEQLRRQLDPDKIDWGRAGYDFGEGFKGSPDERR